MERNTCDQLVINYSLLGKCVCGLRVLAYVHLCMSDPADVVPSSHVTSGLKLLQDDRQAEEEEAPPSTLLSLPSEPSPPPHLVIPEPNESSLSSEVNPHSRTLLVTYTYRMCSELCVSVWRPCCGVLWPLRGTVHRGERWSEAVPALKQLITYRLLVMHVLLGRVH